MFTRKIIIIPFVIAMFYLLSFFWNDWLSITMPRHQLIQLPAMLLLGILLAYCFSTLAIQDMYWGIAILIFIMASFIFWMLPHSIDVAVINKHFNRVMHINMLLSGFLLILVFRKIFFEVKILFLGMITAMLLASGITLSVFNMLLCSSFSIEQQKQTGLYLIFIAIALFIFTAITFFSYLRNRSK
ncbi:MAG: hypothetical protein KF781_02375 [Chitinophagaceae bacterium]|nr:hypothetical protein [Chitinophagaceae bacterium]MCW5904355.1 hypothetical protein [Chitinophagaceae bacterium]